MKNKIIVIVVVALVAVLGAFWGGMKYGFSKNQVAGRASGQFSNLTPEERQQRFMQAGIGGVGGRSGARNAGGFTAGVVISKDDKSITLKLQDGGSKIIFFSSSTMVAKAVGASVNDIVAGGQLVVTGTPNQDGSVTAQSLQIRGPTPEKSN